MKKTAVILFALFALGLSLRAASGVSERTILSTDRAVYVAGDRVWMSAFCMDAGTCRLSAFSGIAYVELHSAEGLAQTAKIALSGGRGAGELTLPGNLPTGNYRLIAYTALNKNEDGFDWGCCARTISVLNPATSAKVGDVEILDESAAVQSGTAPAAGNLTVSIDGKPSRSGVLPLTLDYAGSSPASVSVSVWHDDGIPAPCSFDIAAQISSLKPGKSFTDNVIPEYEGEIVYGRVVGADSTTVEGSYGIIAAPGDKSDVYSASVESDGSVVFFTNNIYGDKDIVCQIEKRLGLPGYLEIISPFVNAPVGEGIPALRLCKAHSEQIQRRAAASRIERLFDADTLYSALPVRENPLFGPEVIRYALDDYTRFPTMEEVFVEIVPELRSRRDENGATDIRVRLNDIYRTARFVSGMSLMMLDGVPVFDQKRILEYDPAMVESVNVYPFEYFIGVRAYSGVANFVTYKRNAPSLEFDRNVRIVDFKGCSMPVAFTARGLGSDYPDYRQTVLWQPLVDLRANAKAELEAALPAYGGEFRVVVDGVAEDGTPLHAETSFTLD